MDTQVEIITNAPAENSGKIENCQPINWPSMIATALLRYTSGDASVSDILDYCFRDAFSERSINRSAMSPMPNNTTRADAREAGINLHEDIKRFYDKFGNRADPMNPLDARSRYVRDMLAALKNEPTEPITCDEFACYRDRSDLTAIHSELSPELMQFYDFVDENLMVREQAEEPIIDRIHNIRGICNALFNANDSDTGLMLYDWKGSNLMVPGSLEVIGRLYN